MHSIYLIRHGQSTANVGGEVGPDKQIPLTHLGQQQALSILTRLPIQPQAIFVSEMLRTQQTAQAFCKHHQMQPHILADLNELCNLDFDRIKDIGVEERRALAQRYWQQADYTYQDGPTADSFAMFDAKVAAFIRQIPQFSDNTVCFTHGIWIGLLAWKLMGFATDNPHSIRQFRQFQCAMVMDNTVIYQLRCDNENRIYQMRLFAATEMVADT